MLQCCTRPKSCQVFPDQVELVELTPRERDVLERISRGDAVKDIAADMFVSLNTVKTQRRYPYQKLDARSGDEAVARARHLGLLVD